MNQTAAIKPSKTVVARAAALTVCMLATWPLVALAADYPNRPIRLVVGYTPGGQTDLIARLLANSLKDRLGQPVVVENRPGAAAQVARDGVAKSPADGYTILTDITGFPAYMVFTRNPTIDVQKAFAPISLLTESTGAIATRRDSPFNSFDEMVAYAKRNPGKVNYGTLGSGVTLLGALAMKQQYGIDIVSVDYKGANETWIALLAGDVHLANGTMGRIVPDVQAGKIKVLVVSGSQRVPSLPNVPSAQEAGFRGMYSSWQGLWAPAGTPPDVVQTLYKAVAGAAATKEVREGLEKIEANVVVSPPAVLAARVEREIREWSAIVKAAGIELK